VSEASNFSSAFIVVSTLYSILWNYLRILTQRTYILLFFQLLLLFSHSVVSDSLWPHGLQHTRLLCPLLSPAVCSNSCPLSHWCYLTISPSAAPFSFCPQSFSASGSFPVSRLFTSGGQGIRASAAGRIGAGGQKMFKTWLFDIQVFVSRGKWDS